MHMKNPNTQYILSLKELWYEEIKALKRMSFTIYIYFFLDEDEYYINTECGHFASNNLLKTYLYIDLPNSKIYLLYLKNL